MSSSSPRSSSDGSFVSAHSSPIRTLSNNDLDQMTMGFYSLPPSPTKPNWRSSYSCDLGADQTNPLHVTLEDHAGSSSLDYDFEFETSQRFIVDEHDSGERRQRKASLPAMAFADDLFCDGKVMPLKPPPCFLSGTFGSVPTTPRSPSMSLRIPIPRRRLWNDEFDPFTTALENVRLEKRGKACQENNNHRRARSMSPMRYWEPNEDGSTGCDQAQDQWKQVEPIFSPRSQVEPIGPYSIWAPGMTMGRPPVLRSNKDQRSPMKLAEPKGVIFARRARMVKMDFEWPKKPNMSEATGNGKEPTREKKRQKIKRFLSKSYSMIKPIDEVHLKLPKSKSLSKMGFKSLGWAQTDYEEKEVAQVAKMTLVHYKPKTFLCMGFGAKYAD